MKIALDIDGTISDSPEFFSLISKAIMAQGGEVHVISYRWEETRFRTEEELDSWGISYTRLHLPADTVRPRDCPAWKASIVTEQGIEVVFEDQPEVLEAMPEGVVRFWLCNPEIFQLGKMLGF